MNRYLVTTSYGGTSHTEVWDGTQALPLGKPFRWVIERSPSAKGGVRVRELGDRGGRVAVAQVKELAADALKRGASLELAIPQRPKMELKIRTAPDKIPAFGMENGAALTLFHLSGGRPMAAHLVDSGWTESRDGRELFRIQSSGNQIQIQSKTEGLHIRRDEKGEAPRMLGAGEALGLSRDQVARLSLSLDHENWRFSWADIPVLKESSESERDAETAWFAKALRSAAIGLATFVLLAYVWPKPKPSEELIPQQFAKIVLARPAHEKAAPSSSAAEAGNKEASSQKVQSAAVVQAFRAKALQHAIKGLLKGGMTQLLAQSDFVSGASARNEVSSLMASRADAARPTASQVGALAGGKMQVAALGGSSDKGVGYGKGEHGGVAGQGHGFVSMDLGSSTVEEGLTKDEVGEVIHRHLSEVRYCYESAMLRASDIEGKLITDFVIGADGRVKSSSVKQSTLPDPRLDDCILRRLVTWQFPHTKGGVNVSVSYPFIFKRL